MAIEDRKIVELLLLRQTSAWNRFVNDYSKLVISRIRITASRCQFDLDDSDVEDICAEVFASLLENNFRSLRQFKGNSRLSTWLSVISHRVCLKQLDKIRAHRVVESNADLNQKQHFEYHKNLLNELINHEQLEQVSAMVATLNEKDRLILDLFYNQQLSYQEISSRTGLSINSIGPKLNRAVYRLRKVMR